MHQVYKYSCALYYTYIYTLGGMLKVWPKLINSIDLIG